MVMEHEDPELGTVRQAGIVLKLSDTPGRLRHVAPSMGAHTDEVLGQLGYSAEVIAALRQRQVVG